MGARTVAGADPGDELAIEIVDPWSDAMSREAMSPDAMSPDAVARVEAIAPESVLTVWIDDLRETVDDVLEPARRVTEATGLTTGAWLHRLGVRRKQRIADRDPRGQSRIRVHVFIPYEAACSRLPVAETTLRARSAVLRFERGFASHRAGLRAPAALHLRGSWPGLPVWVDIEPWWRRQSIVTLSLRSTRRLRYPRRYFAAGHRVLRRLVATLART